MMMMMVIIVGPRARPTASKWRLRLAGGLAGRTIGLGARECRLFARRRRESRSALAPNCAPLEEGQRAAKQQPPRSQARAPAAPTPRRVNRRARPPAGGEPKVMLR